MQDHLSRTFAALADPTRRAMLARLSRGEANVSDLARPFLKDMSLPAVTKHLKVLENAGLVSKGSNAQYRPCRLNGEPLREAVDWMERYRVASLKGTRSVFAERTGGGYFPDFTWNRDKLARYGLTVNDAQSVVQNAIGGENVTRTIEGRERYPVNVRYLPDFRADIGALGRVLVPVSGDRQIPLSQLATIASVSGPAMVRNEDGLLTGYVYIDIAGIDPQSYIHEAKELLDAVIKVPAGYSMAWSGQFEAMERSRQRLLLVVPVTLFLIVMLIYLNTRSWIKTSIVLLAVPFSAIGAVWFLWFLGYNMSVGVWVGMVALLGVDADWQ